MSGFEALNLHSVTKTFSSFDGTFRKWLDAALLLACLHDARLR